MSAITECKTEQANAKGGGASDQAQLRSTIHPHHPPNIKGDPPGGDAERIGLRLLYRYFLKVVRLTTGFLVGSGMASSLVELALAGRGSVASATSLFSDACTSSCIGAAGGSEIGVASATSLFSDACTSLWIGAAGGSEIGVTRACTCAAGSQSDVSALDDAGAPIANDDSEFCVLVPIIITTSTLPMPNQTAGSLIADLIENP